MEAPPFPLPPSSPAPPAVEEEKTLDLWYVGAIINVVGSVSINLGMNLMKLGHTKRAELDMPEEEKPPIRKFKVWLIGIIIFTTGNVLNFVSFAFAAQSLLAALGSLQLVCNVFFAFMVNHEPVTKLIILSTLCIIGGCVLLVVFGNQSSETYTVDDLVNFYKEPAYIVYLVMMGVVVFGSYVLYLHSKKVCRKQGQGGVWYFSMLAAYSIFSAMLGSQSVLFGKSISVILRTTFSGDNQLGNWYTWVVLPVFTFAALFWVTRLNKGLRMFPAMVIVPLMQISWTLFSIVSGMVYFEEYKGFTTLMWIMFPIGVLIVFSGVFLLTVGGSSAGPLEDIECEDLPDSAVPSTTKMLTVHDNAMFSARPDGESGASELGPPPTSQKMSLGQTLRFTSTWAPASVAVSPGSNMNRTMMTNESMRRQRRATEANSDFNATGRSNRTDEQPYSDREQHNATYDKNSTLNRTAQSNASRLSETPSMMGTMKKGIKSMHNRLTSDLGVETKTGFKLAMGLGDSGLTAVSLFAMPALDFTSTKRTSRSGASAMGAPAMGASESSILNALPRSKFFKGDLDGLTTIAEGSGVPTKAPSLDMGASLTASSQLHASSRDDSHSPPGGGRLPPKGHLATVAAAQGRPSTRPLDDASFLGMLPGPSFKPPRTATAAGDEVPKTPSMAPAGAVAGPSFRAGRQRAGQPADGSVPLPGFGPGLGPAAATPPPALDYEPSVAAQGGSRVAGMYGSGAAAYDSGAVAPGPSGPGRPMARPGSLGALLPEGVPLSSANSMVLHESRPSTPPEVMLGGAGPSNGYQGVRMASPRLQQQHSQQQQYAAPIPLSVLQRAHTPPLTSARLPPLHLMVPGMPIMVQMQQAAQHPAGGQGMLMYAPPSASYAQMLAPTLSAPPRVLAPAYSLASAGGAFPASPSAVLLHSRNHQSPRGLSVSRSWAGFGSVSGSGGASRNSPLRGSMLGQMQRPLRPWQH